MSRTTAVCWPVIAVQVKSTTRTGTPPRWLFPRLQISQSSPCEGYSTHGDAMFYRETLGRLSQSTKAGGLTMGNPNVNTPRSTRHLCHCISNRPTVHPAGRKQRQGQARKFFTGAQNSMQAVESSAPRSQVQSHEAAAISTNSSIPKSNKSIGTKLDNGTIARPPRSRVSRKGPGSDTSPNKRSATRQSEIPVALTNLRLLIHTDHRLLASLPQKESAEQRSHSRNASTIAPPLTVLQHLFSSLESSKSLSLLTATDWDILVYWFVHYDDHRSLDQLHRTLVGHTNPDGHCSPRTYLLLTEGRLSHLRQQRGTGLPSTTELTDVVKRTIEWMRSAGIHCDQELPTLWLKTCVQERNWRDGVKAWTDLSTNSSARGVSETTSIFAILSYLNLGKLSDAGALLQSSMERSMTALQRQNFASVADNSLSGEGRSEGDSEVGFIDGKAEYLRRYKEATQEVFALQERNVGVDQQFIDPAGMESIMTEWRNTVYPIMIEIISLGKDDKAGALLASDLAVGLLENSHPLDRTRFRLLTRFIGSTSGSTGAEKFLLKCMEASRFAKPDAQGPLNDRKPSTSPSSPLKKTKKGVSAVALIEIGLQELVKRAAAEGNLDRARRIFDGMARQGIALDVDTAETLLLEFCQQKDFQPALQVLEKSLQDKRVPSITAANVLLQELVRSDRLDESVAVFRDLTEKHGLKPDQTTYRRLLNLTSMHGQLAMSQRVLSTLFALGVKRDGELYRDLMLGYIRSGNFDGAIKIFENMDKDGVKHDIRHINVLLEGAVHHSSSSTIIGILEILSSLSLRPDPETWRILLRGALLNKDKNQARTIFHELSHSVVKGPNDKADGALRASRHQDTFETLVKEYAVRHGSQRALRILKAAKEAGYPRDGKNSSLEVELKQPTTQSVFA
ncbi:hypothetical protein EMPS_10591 [Entomortierella parvispora]|uniref:PROP1-like PPR domain-containing protein n=1 Tax=Entomortierella parvispora TaxID=205924 RepID=A0A9P3M1G9_9FUNG|nr:hypothetical protein EMPS_10591 [Entomortierella parvispora]